jgi:ubiquinone/menaquinone biosynthesis C-methylase UbiE
LCFHDRARRLELAVTSETSSYRIGEARFRDVAAELARLKAQADVAWPQELAALRRHGLATDSDVLEAGCGPGFVTQRLLEHVRDGSVTALDVDSAMLAHARELVATSHRARFLEASAVATGLPDAAFDVVVARFLLQHLPDVPAALTEFRRVLRPGGRLIVVDGDNDFSLLFDPEPPFYRELMDAVASVHRRHGGDSRIGRRLPRLLDDAGFAALAVDAVATHSAVAGRDAIRAVIPLHALDHMEATGALSPELAAHAREFTAEIDSGERAFDGLLCYLVVSGAAERVIPAGRRSSP